MNKLFFLTLFLISLFAKGESFVYITDQVDIPMRADKTFDNNIVHSLPSGTKMSILQATEDGWTQVKYENMTGWIISRYLSNNPPARKQLKILKRKHNASKLLAVKQDKKNTKLETQLKTLKTKNAALLMQASKSQAEKIHVETIYKDALKLEHSNDKLITQVLQLKTEIQLLENNHNNNQDASSRNWFIIGAIVLFFGFMMGFIFPKHSKQRRF